MDINNLINKAQLNSALMNVLTKDNYYSILESAEECATRMRKRYGFFKYVKKAKIKADLKEIDLYLTILALYQKADLNFTFLPIKLEDTQLELIKMRKIAEQMLNKKRWIDRFSIE